MKIPDHTLHEARLPDDPSDPALQEVTTSDGAKARVSTDSIEPSNLTLCRPPLSQGIEGAPITVAASSNQENANALLDCDGDEIWHSDRDKPQELTFDFGGTRKLGGIVIDWGTKTNYEAARLAQAACSEAPPRPNNDTANRLAVFVPANPGWTQIYGTDAAPHHRTFIYLPETEASQLKLVLFASNRGRGYGIRSVEFKPIGFSKTANDLWSAVAKEAPRGCYPDYFNGRQTLWTVVCEPQGDRKALLSEHGSLEVDRLGFTIEPFLRIGADFLGWANAEFRQSPADGDLPIPSVTRVYQNCELTIATVIGKRGRTTSVRVGVTYLRYRIKNTSTERLSGKLFAAIRPFQVNPPWQFLDGPGGFAPIRYIAWENGAVRVNDNALVIPFTSPSPFGATNLDGGDISAHLEHNVFPVRTQTAHQAGFASGALGFLVDVQPGCEQEIYLAVTGNYSRKRVGDPVKGFAAGLVAWQRKRAQVKKLSAFGAEIADMLNAQAVFKDKSTARSVGDAPPACVDSDFFRPVRALFLYEREESDASVLVVGAGLTKALLEEGFDLPQLRTRFGQISLSTTTNRVNRVNLSVTGNVRSVVKLALPSGFSEVFDGKRKLVPDGRGEVVLNLPASLTLISEATA